MKIKILHIILLILSFIWLGSCEEEINWEIQEKEEDLLIVDGFISSYLTQHSIKLSMPSTEINHTPIPVSNASITISDGTRTYYLHEDSINSGTYKTDTLQAVLGRNYYLSILYNNKRYEAQSTMAPLIGTHTPLKYSTINDTSEMYKIDFIAPSFNIESPAMHIIEMDWKDAPGYENASPDTCRAKTIFYSLPSIDVAELFTASKEKIEFPKGTKITQRILSLTDEQADFARSFLLETQWRGGLFDVSPANVNTNISSGGAGFFAVCTEKRLGIIVE